MTVMYSFCLWFPVRLGAIIVAICCAGESLACLIACGVGLSNTATTLKTVTEWIEKHDMGMAGSFFNGLRSDPEGYLNGFIIALSVHLTSCAFLLLGVFKCFVWLIYPFLCLDFVRLVCISVALVFTLLLIKANTLTLGYVIGTSIAGGFLILYMWYQWFCVVSLCQIINEVDKMNSGGQAAPLVHPMYQKKQADVGIYPHTIYGKSYVTNYGSKAQYMMDMPRPTY